MPTATAGIYQVVLEQNYGSETLKNVWHYLHSVGDDDEQSDCAQAFDDDMMFTIAAITNTSLSFNEIRVANLTGLLADAVLVPSESEGNIVGSLAPSFVAASYRYVRTSKETRNGAKRFCGMVEENLNGNDFTSAYFTTLQSAETTFASTLTGATGVYEPIILRKPDIGGVWLYNEVATVIALNRVTTQTSRKFF